MYGAVLGSVYLAIDQGWVRTNKRTSSKGEGQSDETFNLVTTTNKFVRFAEDLGIAQYLEVERVNSKTGTFLLAWIATKFTEPRSGVRPLVGVLSALPGSGTSSSGSPNCSRCGSEGPTQLADTSSHLTPPS
ncbi:hypothetical protein PRIC1_014079 [Phytophthora ramorum]